MSVALAAAVSGAACAGADVGARVDNPPANAERVPPGSDDPTRADSCGRGADDAAALVAVGPASDLVAALHAGDAARAREAAAAMLETATAEAAATFHDGGTDAATMRAFMGRWVYATTPSLAVELDRFVLHPRLQAAIESAACVAERR